MLVIKRCEVGLNELWNHVFVCILLCWNKTIQPALLGLLVLDFQTFSPLSLIIYTVFYCHQGAAFSKNLNSSSDN